MLQAVLKKGKKKKTTDCELQGIVKGLLRGWMHVEQQVLSYRMLLQSPGTGTDPVTSAWHHRSMQAATKCLQKPKHPPHPSD